MNNTNAHKPGYKHTPLGWIPTDWHTANLSEVAVVQGGYAFDSKKFKQDGKYQVIKMSNLYNGDLDLERSSSFLDTISKQEANFILKKDDIIITLTGTVGKRDYGYSYRIDSEKNLLLNQRVARITTNANCDTGFLSYELKTNRALNQFFYAARGGTGNQANVGTGDLELIRVISPPLPEQQTIACILNTWDKAIQKTQQLIEQLKQRNKGLSQQLLSGKKRLSGFSGKWKEYLFDDCFKIVKSYSLSREYLSQKNEVDNIFCIHYGDIHALYKTIFLDFDTEKRIPQIINQNFVLKEEDYLVDGDIIMADVSEDYEGVGEAVEVINLNDKKAVGGLHTIVIREIKELSHRGFLAYLFDSENVRNELRTKATGTSVYSISKATLKSLTFKLPELDEQKAIADFLSESLTELKLYEEQLITLQQQKKGLMQKLLSGEVRVKI